MDLNDKNLSNPTDNAFFKQKEENDINNNLEFLTTLIRLKSPNNAQSKVTNTFSNNEDYSSKIKEMDDLEKRQFVNFNEFYNNKVYDENSSFNHNKLLSNSLKINTNCNKNSSIKTNSLKVNHQHKYSDNISNNKNANFLSSVNGYFNRRHHEEISKLEKIKKEIIEKEKGEIKNVPQINKKSKKIAEKLTSRQSIQEQQRKLKIHSVSPQHNYKKQNDNLLNYNSQSKEINFNFEVHNDNEISKKFN